MKTLNNISILLLCVLSMLAVSCQKDEVENRDIPENCGQLSLQSLGIDDEIQVVGTKAFGMDANTFKVELIGTGEENAGTHLTYESFSKLKEQDYITLPVGRYTLKAYSREKVNSGVYDDPYFYGENTEVVILEKKITTVSLECTFQSVAVDIDLTRTFNNYFEDNYQMKVINGIGKECLFTKEHAGKVIYFDNVEGGLKLEYTVQAKGKDAAYPARIKDLLNKGMAPKAGDYYMVEFTGEEPDTKAL